MDNFRKAYRHLRTSRGNSSSNTIALATRMARQNSVYNGLQEAVHCAASYYNVPVAEIYQRIARQDSTGTKPPAPNTSSS